jgi:hypothetical protein
MISLDQPLGVANPTSHFAQTVRQRISAIPERVGQPERDLTGFSVARILTTFQFKRLEYFPEGLSDPAFDMLIDLFLHDSLNWRVGSSQGSGLHLPKGQALVPGIDELLEAGFVALIPADDLQAGQLMTLSRSGRARLNIFFDYMAEYISAM